METNHDIFRLDHIKDCIDKIEKLVSILKSFESFENQWIERDAMIRNFEIIGEASNHISKEIKIKYPEVYWNERNEKLYYA